MSIMGALLPWPQPVEIAARQFVKQCRSDMRKHALAWRAVRRSRAKANAAVFSLRTAIELRELSRVDDWLKSKGVKV